jgi:hypothetical protein
MTGEADSDRKNKATDLRKSMALSAHLFLEIEAPIYAFWEAIQN